MTLAGLRQGMRAAVPLMIGLTPFGLVVGIVSQSKGLSLAETLLMSGVVYAGTAQLLAMELWPTRRRCWPPASPPSP